MTTEFELPVRALPERELGQPSLLSHKYVPPGLPARVLRRDRLNDLYREAFEQHRVVTVVGGAGTGKTVQAQLFASDSPRAVAWLTLDIADASPSRFLTDLAVCIDYYCAGSTDALHWALRSGAGAVEAAATLAETLGSEPLLLVIDDGEVLLHDPVLVSSLATFLDYAPETLHCLVMSRASLGGPLRQAVLEGRYAKVDDEYLRLSPSEVGDFLEVRGMQDVSADALHEASGGWMAGLVFGSRFDSSQPTQSPEFTDYLREAILGELSEAEREFLIKASLVEVITPEIAGALIGPQGSELYHSVVARHLPAMTSNGEHLVIHSVVRAFLRSELEITYAADKAALFRRGAELYELNGDRERATDWYLQAGDLDAAVRTAELELPRLYARSDWATVARWLDRFGQTLVDDRPLLVGARIRSLFGRRQFDEAVSAIRSYDQRGRLREATDVDRGLLATVGWALQADASEANRYLAKYQGDYRVEAVKYMFAATTGVEAAVPPIEVGGTDVERLVSWGLLWQGRLEEVLRLAPSTEDTPVLNPNTILAYLWRGDVESGREMWMRVPELIRQRAHSKFIEACIRHAEGDVEGALSAARDALGDSRRVGFQLDSVYEVLVAYFVLVLGRSRDALATLERKIHDLSQHGDLANAEMAQTWYGLALLREDRVEEARLVLEECVRSMARAQRRLFYPAASVLLSEALRRLGEDEAASAAANDAYQVASLIGSFFWLLEALRAVPDVLEAEVQRDPSDSRWRRLRFAPSAAQGVSHGPVEESTVVLVQPFGPDRDLLVNGERVGVGRLKVLELATCLALHPNGIDRAELQRRLFPEVDQRRGGNHFRQIAHKLRGLIGASLGRSGNLVTWPAGVVIESQDLIFERLIASASAATGRARMQLLADALADVSGDYLESSDLPWVEERRFHLDVVREEVLTELAALAFDLDELERARDAAERVLQLNVFSEDAYLLLMRVENAIGTPASCRAVLRRATEALSELGVEPSARLVALAHAVH